MLEFSIKSVNLSDKKGIPKTPVSLAIIAKGIGLKGDAHRGMKNRQISLLSREEIDAFKPDLADGSFGENFTTLGLDTNKVRLLDRIILGNSIMEICKIGKTCHDRCHIYHTMGDCIMPKKGYFVRVIKGNQIVGAGTKATYIPKIFKAAIITLSDRASAGVYEDQSGAGIETELEKHFSGQGREAKLDRILIPDSRLKLFILLLKLLIKKYDIIITTGGTGVSPSDITIEIIKLFIKKEIPGIMEYVRSKYGPTNRNALTSRSIAGVRGKTLIFSLPGSQNAVKEYLAEIIPMLDHLIAMVHDLDSH